MANKIARLELKKNLYSIKISLLSSLEGQQGVSQRLRQRFQPQAPLEKAIVVRHANFGEGLSAPFTFGARTFYKGHKRRVRSQGFRISTVRSQFKNILRKEF